MDKTNRRSDRIILTNEARVLRDLRVGNNLSMKKAGNLLGKSDSYIAHIETGRMDPPVGQKLDAMLAIYGGMKQKSFYERVRNYRKIMTTKDELTSLIQRLNESNLKTALHFVKTLLSE